MKACHWFMHFLKDMAAFSIHQRYIPATFPAWQIDGAVRQDQPSQSTTVSSPPTRTDQVACARTTGLA